MSAGVVPLREWLKYRGREGMWAWILHRITGLGVMFFLIWHILDIFLIALGPEEFNRFLALYKAPPFRILEIFLVFSLIYHALNGARIIIMDFAPGLMEHEARLFWVVLILAVVITVPAGALMVAPLFGG